MYSVHHYGRMAADGVRMDAYARAIARAVRPGSVVVDIGAGTGIMSLLAARAGAKRVHAIDPNPAIWLVPELAKHNGVADRIIVHHASSLEVAIPEPADVVLSDLRGTTPLNLDHLAVIRDARARLLRPGGALIPEEDRLFCALVESEDMWRQLSRAWESFERRGLDPAPARASILNSAHPDVLAPVLASDLLSEGACWATLDYATHDGAVVEDTVDLAFVRGGFAHGICVWFEATILDDIAFSSAPGGYLAYSRCFLPLSEPVRVEAGARAHVTLRADVRGERWAWETEIGDGEARRSFRQSTFFGRPTDPAALLREASTYRPTRSERGERMRRVLEAMDGERTVAELAERASPNLPPGSPLRAVVLDETRAAVGRYGR